MKSKKILMTGTTSGIGRSCLELFLKNGYECYVINRRLDKEQSERVTKYFVCDLSQPQEVKTLCDSFTTEHFDVLINNAGYGEPLEFQSIDIGTIDYEFNLNFVAPLLLMQAVLPQMKLHQLGKIINMSSITAHEPTPFLFTYSAAKSALNNLSQSLARSLAGSSVTIHTICPGGVNTQMSVRGRKKLSELHHTSEDIYQNNMIQKMGTGELISPESVATFVDELISSQVTRYTSGQIYNLCGLLSI